MKSPDELRRQRRRAIIAVAILAPISVATFLATKVVFKQYRVPAGSMIPTIHRGDRVFVNRLAYAFGAKPKVGEVVSFRSPVQDARMLKRVMAGPGDTIEMRDNVVFVNGKRRHEPYIVLTPDVAAVRTFPPITVPPGHYFVLGDNRDNSNDSRFIGPIPEDHIGGRMSYVLHIGQCGE